MRSVLRATFLSLTLLTVAAPVQSAVNEFVVPGGPLITLQNGRVIEGHVVRIDQTDVIIQTLDGATETFPRATVQSMSFQTVTGRELVGELVGWTPGVYQIATPEAAIKVYSTLPATSVPQGATIAEAPEGRQEFAVEDVDAAEVVDAAEGDTATEEAGQGSSQAIAAVQVDADAAQGQDAAATPTADLTILVSVENSRENGPPVVFNIELSEPAESSVVLIYATIDGTAVNGEDYEANRGVVVMKPGEQMARIEAPVLDDSEMEEQEHLQLFLTVDPSVAVVENRQIIATIDDDDQG